MTGMTVTWTGLSELEGRLSRSQATAVPLVAAALYAEAETWMTEAKHRTPVGGGEFSPYDRTPGTLRASGHVRPPVISGTQVLVTLGFGGAAQAYAMVQHEHDEFRHEVGQAHYLSSVFDERSGGLGEAMAVRLKGKLL